MEKYVKEVNPLKQNLILLNKADYLTEQQRLDWAKYLKVIAFIYFILLEHSLSSIGLT